MLFVILILCNSMHYDFSRPLAIRCVCKHTDGTANATVLGAFHLVPWKLVCSNATVLGAFRLVANLCVVFIHITQLSSICIS